MQTHEKEYKDSATQCNLLLAAPLHFAHALNLRPLLMKN